MKLKLKQMRHSSIPIEICSSTLKSDSNLCSLKFYEQELYLEKNRKK